MCGIAGCVVPSGERPDPGALRRMAESLVHRGPDGSAVEIHGSVGLVNTRLAILEPTQAGRQPMADPSGRWVVTYNGEIYNHSELREQLSPTAYRGRSDTETLLHALRAWGPAAVPRLNGPFAFAALDTSTRRLLLARDRFGKKPLYVARHRGVLWFASEMRALFAAGVPRRARRDVLTHSLVHGWPQGGATPVEGVERLLPGRLGSVDLDTLEMSVTAWFRPDARVDPELADRLARSGRESLVSLLEETMRAAVRRRLISDVPLGVMCSGGLDSSLVAALAREDGRSLVAFAGSVAGRHEHDELPWARRAAAHLGLPLEVASVDADSWRSGLVAAVEHHEYPLQHESAVSIAQISALARRHGVKVLLTGEGADELFGGYPFRHRSEFDLLFDGGSKRASRGLTGPARSRRMARPAGSQPATQPLPELPPAPEVRAYERAVGRSALAAYAHHRGPAAAFEAGLLGDLSRSVLPFLLNRMDKNAMQSSVETRVPFLDPSVVGLALNLPVEHRVGRERKSLLHEVAARHLPADVAARPKQIGLEASANRWLIEAARPEFLADGKLREILGLPLGRWRAIVDGLAGRRVLSAWTGEAWCRLALEGSAPQAVESDLWR